MRREIPAVRILPMSNQLAGFRGRSIKQVQHRVFLQILPARKGRYRYRSSGLNAPPGTIVLFQFSARIIASAVLVSDERFERPLKGVAGVLHFDPASFLIFDPVDSETMQTIWPQFRRFGHVKQFLNPARYSSFKRRMKHVRVPQ